MKTIKKLVQGMLVALGVLGLAAAASAAPKSITTCRTIDDPGSYLVTKNLTATGNCLVVKASHVTIDLGGYVLSGNGTGTGIKDTVGGLRGVTVRNGTVRGFDDGIVLIGFSGMVDQVRVHDNVSLGIYVGPGYLVKASVASNNGSFGIGLQCPASAVGNTAIDNIDLGDNLVTFGTGCVLSQNLAP
jgi:hypothetical protein